MKKKYTIPELELIRLTLCDVLTASQGSEPIIPEQTDPFDPGDPSEDLDLS